MDWLINPSSTGGKFLVMVVAIVVFVLVMGLILFAVDRPKRVPRWLVATAFAGPAIALVAVGLVYPGILTIVNSFKSTNGREWVGLANYTQAFTEGQFQLVLRNTAVWVILVPILATAIGLIYAVLVDRTRFEKLAKALIFLPMAISFVGASIIWKFVYAYRPDQGSVKQIGLLNQVLVWFGGEPQQFLLNTPWNTFFLLIVLIWIQAGFAMTILSASIKAIPEDVIEAATLDGAGRVQMFRFVTVPSIRPTLVVVLTTISIASLKVFDIVRTMTGGQFDTSVVANEFYSQSFRADNQGLGAALAVLLFALVIPIVVYNVRQMRSSEAR